MRLLIVEDEISLADILRESLAGHGFEVVCTHSADEAWEAVWKHPFDLIVLDIMLPEGDDAGFRLAEEVRDAGFRQPILFLTARETLPDRVRGLEYGDDYLAKPFALAELVARLKALFRRGEMRPRRVAWGDVVLLPEERQVRLRDAPVRLTAKEYEVLELLMINPGRIFSREDILERIWGVDFETPSNLVDVYVKNVRSKLGEAMIETVRGMGYRFPGLTGATVNLRLKLALIASLLTLLGLALGLGLTYWLLLGLRLNELDTEGRLLAEVILDAAIVRSDDLVRIPAVVENYLTDASGVSSAQVYLDGQLLWEGGVVTAPRPLDPKGLLGEPGGRSVADWRVYTLAAAGEGITVQVGRPLVGTWDILRPYNWIAIPVTLLLTLLVGVVAWPTVGFALRPLRILTEAAGHFEDASDVPTVPGQGEPAKLARSFAALLTRLRAERQREQEFLAYAAHELRTPLSALRAGLEAARSQKLHIGPEMLDRLYHEALRLETLAQNFLALSRAEAGEIRVATIDLGDLASEAYDRFLPLAIAKGLELQLLGEAAPTLADARLVEQALNNLLSNALRCTPRGVITIRSGMLSGRSFLEIEDSGPGLPDPIREGLGLRVVRAVMRAHAGELVLASKPGTLAALWLPESRAQPMAGGRPETGTHHVPPS